jgi:hypothetical protein
MSLYLLFCPLCGEMLEGVDTERCERENKPDVFRCTECGRGWEILTVNGKYLVSQAKSYDRPNLKVVK